MTINHFIHQISDFMWNFRYNPLIIFQLFMTHNFFYTPSLNILYEISRKIHYFISLIPDN